VRARAGPGELLILQETANDRVGDRVGIDVVFATSKLFL
jgi:hypothetical protein